MRLKTFSASSMTDALKIVKEHFGEDAIIVSSQKGENGLGVSVTAAIDSTNDTPSHSNDLSIINQSNTLDLITESLAHHGTPPSISEKLIDIINGLDLDDTDTALAASIDQLFNFKKLPTAETDEIFMLIGLPGAGKTVTTAKLATRAIMAGKKVNVISTDKVRAGGFEQLEAFTKILDIDLMSARDPNSLKDAIMAGNPEYQTIIDCAGGNPFKRSDFLRQSDFIKAIDAKVIMLLADGTDPLEAADLAQAYAELGAKGLIITRIDVARRHGSVLSAAAQGNLSIYGIGVGPSVSDGLKTLNPVSLARLLLSGLETK
jgi:flagellar biosynthesis protein FlhF